MTREEAITWLEKHVPNKNLRKHMFATEAVMRELAREFQIAHLNLFQEERVHLISLPPD